MSTKDSTYTSDGSGRKRQTKKEYVWDEKKGEWVSTKKTTETTTTTEKTDPKDTVSPGSTNSNTSSQTDSKTAAEKEYIEIEFNTLEGELSLTPTPKAFKIKVNETVDLKGLGKHLSGKYFVSAIKRTISKDGGYSQTLTVIKNGFSDSLKKTNTVQTVNRKDPVEKTTPS